MGTGNKQESVRYFLLFDIDGTLMHTGGAGRTSMEKALYELFGLEKALDLIPMMGRTDPLIFKDALENNGIKWTSEIENKLKDKYFNILRQEMEQPREGEMVCSGMNDLLENLSKRDDVFLGLLTGNYKESAYIKLNHFGLGQYFTIGAFSDDSHDRNLLGAVAMERFEKKFGFFVPNHQVYVIGDTPFDIECARPHNFKSIAVATGIHSYEELKSHDPDYVFRDLSDINDLLKILL